MLNVATAAKLPRSVRLGSWPAATFWALNNDEVPLKSRTTDVARALMFDLGGFLWQDCSNRDLGWLTGLSLQHVSTSYRLQSNCFGLLLWMFWGQVDDVDDDDFTCIALRSQWDVIKHRNPSVRCWISLCRIIILLLSFSNKRAGTRTATER